MIKPFLGSIMLWYHQQQHAQQQQAVSLRAARKHQGKRTYNEFKLLAFGVSFIIIAYFLAFSVFSQSKSQPLRSDVLLLEVNNNGTPIQRQTVPLDTSRLAIGNNNNNNNNNLTSTTTTGGYDFWRNVAVRLAKLPPDELLKELEASDPFETRAFEAKLVKLETSKGAVLDLADVFKLFQCPNDARRITLPDMRNHSRDQAFRNANNNNNQQDYFTFLFFQHLRKAGGTNFCSLAQKNLPRAAVPTYFCMPDKNWNLSRPVCAGCFHQWTNEDIANNMKAKGHRIAGNEWDAFEPDRFFNLPAVFATSFRKPLDRALSQFRFECIEDRGCKILNITKWWQESKQLYNVYTWTFTNMNRYGVFRVYQSNLPADGERRGNYVGQALDVVAKFHLVLVMEWLAYASPLVKSTLGFSDTSMLTHRVRPHISQYQRKDGQEENQMGAAGVGKASWTPENYLSKEQYKVMSETLALDMILNDAARRIFLERLVCEMST